jgi:branched-chain amino acid transport system permease protein
MNRILENIRTSLLHPRIYFPFMLIVFLVLVPLLPRNPFYEDIIVSSFFYGTLALAWNLVGGFAGQISLGHTAFFGIGAYTSTLLNMHYGLSPWLGMLAGAGLSVVVAIAIGIPCFRLKSHFFALATIAIAEVMRFLASYWRGLTQGGVGLLIPFKPGIQNFMFGSKLPYAYIALAFMLIMAFVSYVIRNSRFGFQLIALREDQDAAESLGIRTFRCKLQALAISAFFASICGTFYGQYIQFVDPSTVFSLGFSVELALFTIIGGIGTVIGPILGAFMLTPLDVFLRGWFGGVSAGLNLIIYGLVLMVAVRYFPLGILGWVKSWYDPLLQKLPGGRKALKTESRIPPPVVSSAVLEPPGKHEKAPFFEVKSLCKRFGGLVAVGNVSFKIQKGEIVGLIGPNGAGKTTIFNLITGFIPPDSGCIELRGEIITGLRPPHRICLKRIGRTFQLVKPFKGMTAAENVMVGTFARTRKAQEARTQALEILDFIGLMKHQDSLASSLTIADRKRLELGRTLATKPDLLLLDEVVAGLNPKETQEIIEVIKNISNRGITILMIAHVMKAVMALSDRIIVIHHGEKIAEGTPRETSRDKRVIEAYLGEEYLA